MIGANKMSSSGFRLLTWRLSRRPSFLRQIPCAGDMAIGVSFVIDGRLNRKIDAVITQDPRPCKSAGDARRGKHGRLMRRVFSQCHAPKETRCAVQRLQSRQTVYCVLY